MLSLGGVSTPAAAADGPDWLQRAKLFAGDGDSGDRFGFSVALDGDTALVGAFDDEDPNGSGAGSAYVFVPNPRVRN